MKLDIIEGKVVVRSETSAEADSLWGFYKKLNSGSVKSTEVGVVERKQHRKHKLHTFKKACVVCGKICNGKIGLGVHMANHKKNSPAYIGVNHV